MPYAFDPELAPIVELLPSGDMRDVAQSREGILALLEPLNRDVDTTGVTISDHDVPTPGGSVPVRVYAPAATAPAARPALLDIHGGGFVVGSIDMEHAFATQVARDLDAVVVTPEYRLAPEHPFPAAVDDCYATLQWMHDRRPRARHRSGARRRRRPERGWRPGRGDRPCGPRSGRPGDLLPVSRDP